MSESLPPDHPIAKLTPEEKAALPLAGPGAGLGDLVAMTLDGIGITSDGKLKKSKYLNVISNSMDDYSTVLLTREEIGKLRNAAIVMKHGANAAMPIICAGPACMFASRCPWQQIGKAPVGLACVWELSLMKQWQLNWLEEYDVDPDNMTEMTLVNELVEVEIHLHRCNLFLAMNPTHAVGVVDQMVGVDKKGNPVMQAQISQHIELREKLFARKHRLLKLLVGDRQEKYKKEAALKTRESTDPSSSMATLKEQMEALQRQLTRAGQTVTGQVVDSTTEKLEENSLKSISSDGHDAMGPLHPDDLPGDEE